MLVIQFLGEWHQRERELKETEKATNGCVCHSVVNLKDKRVKTKWKKRTSANQMTAFLVCSRIHSETKTISVFFDYDDVKSQLLITTVARQR